LILIFGIWAKHESMLRVGLTGGIGSGKSTVARIFEVLGIPVFYADDEAKRILNENQELKQSIIKNFGEDSYKDGLLNRGYMASIVFNDKEKLQLLNSLTHPVTMRNGEAWMKKQTTSYAVHEAALIFEAGVSEELDYVIGVTAPEALRIRRVMNRDAVTREEVIKRMSRQIEEDIKMKLCDFVLVNDEQQLLTPQVLAVHKDLLSLSSRAL
jgi:dephospho-CoA kinase